VNETEILTQYIPDLSTNKERALLIPSEITFANLIGIEGNQWHYHIPRFQREYV